MTFESSLPLSMPRAAKSTETNKAERIAKVIARAGLCSRREAERWIKVGRVKLDGKVLTTPAVTVTAKSNILVDGAPLPEAGKARLWRYHKPAGLLTTNKDPEGRPSLFDSLPDDLPRVISVGRLDLKSEGLLLLTNDGELARKMELPANNWSRRYRVRVNGRIEENKLLELAKGVTIDGVRYRSIQAVLDRQQGANAWLTITLTEGKNREIRKVMDHLGWPVNRLIRVAFGPFQLGNLKKGDVEEVKGKVLKEQLGQGGGPMQMPAKPEVKGTRKRDSKARKPKAKNAHRRRQI